MIGLANRSTGARVIAALRFAMVLSATLTLAPLSARAAHVRPRFEPTDLELERPGTLQLDCQLGATTGDDIQGRLFTPDYEIDLGLSDRVEIGLDGAVTVEPLRTQARVLTAEPFWLSTKIGLLDLQDLGAARGAALGIQVGPRLSFGSDAHGAGYEALALIGAKFKRVQTALNLGGLVDPPTVGASHRPYGALVGLDVQVDFDDDGDWSLLGEASVGYYLAEVPKTVTFTAGLQRGTDAADFSIVALATPIGNADRYGLLLGITPRVRLW